MAAATGSQATLLPGQSPPFYTITSTDQAGTIVIVTAVCLAMAFVSILVRAYVLLQSGTFRLRWDDWAVCLALALAVIQMSLVEREASLGLGTTIQETTRHDTREVQRLQFVDQLFYILSTWTCKTSAALFFYRLSPKRTDRKLSQATLILITVTAIAAMLILSLVCNLSQPWYYFNTQGVTCSAPYHRWIAVATINIFTEVVLACLAITIFWPLQMRLAMKLAAGFIFLQRLILVVPIVGQLHYLSFVYRSTDPTLQATYSTLCREVEVALAIITTNIQCFRPFLQATATNYGAPAKEELSTYGQGADAGGSVELSKLNNSQKSRNSAQLPTDREEAPSRTAFSPTGRNHFSANVTSDAAQHGDTISICTDDSANMIIRKELDYTVHYHDDEAGSSERPDNPHFLSGHSG